MRSKVIASAGPASGGTAAVGVAGVGGVARLGRRGVAAFDRFAGARRREAVPDGPAALTWGFSFALIAPKLSGRAGLPRG
jgi:hypothetical protein